MFHSFNIENIKDKIISRIEVFTHFNGKIYLSGDKRESCIYCIKIFFESGDHAVIESYGDCCSFSWIRQDNMDNINDLIGRKIVRFMEDKSEEINFDFSQIQECDESYKYIIKTEDGYEFIFFLTNSSNGYYSGSISIFYVESIDKKLDTKITFVVGLPGSGKSHLFKENAFDDFLTSKRDEIDIYKLISENKKMYIIDPLFTNITTFKECYNLFAKYVEKENISVVVFRPDHAKCRNNLEKDIVNLYDTLAKKLKIRFDDKLIIECNNAVSVIMQRIISLTNMSKNYNIDDYFEFNPNVIDVY